MRQHLRQTFFSRAGALHLAIVVSLALGNSLPLSAGAIPIRLLGVSAQGNAVLIESAEPAAYVVKRPDALTVVVELRNVSAANAAQPALEQRDQDPIASLTVEQGTGDDGQAVARVRVGLSRPAEYAVRSARNTIRLELTAPVRPAASEPATQLPAGPGSRRESMNPAPLRAEVPSATILDRVRSKRTTAATTITLGGNGRLTPADVTEAEGAPRRLLLDFPNVTSTVPTQVSVDGPLVTRVSVSLNSRTPVVTRVVMDISAGATYHVERTGNAGSDLAVVFEPPQKSSTVLLAPPASPAKAVAPEPDIPLEQAIANAASITPKDTPVESPAVVADVAAKVPPAAAPAAKAPTPPPATVARQQTAPPPPPATAARPQTLPTAPAQQPAPRPNQQIITST
ncbi:MAG: AMIN domain-containing protein, partial [Vicinamibacterales bacterium]